MVRCSSILPCFFVADSLLRKRKPSFIRLIDMPFPSLFRTKKCRRLLAEMPLKTMRQALRRKTSASLSSPRLITIPLWRNSSFTSTKGRFAITLLRVGSYGRVNVGRCPSLRHNRDTSSLQRRCLNAPSKRSNLLILPLEMMPWIRVKRKQKRKTRHR